MVESVKPRDRRSRSRSAPRGGRDDKNRDRSRERGRDDHADGRLREDERGGLFRAGRGGRVMGMGGGGDPRGPPLDARGFGGDSRGLGRGGGVGYPRGGLPSDVRGPPGRSGGLAAIGPPMMGPPRVEAVDREKQCPMLIRIFCKFGEFHRDEEFSYIQQPVEDEVLVHTWRDATLSELTELLAQEHREVRLSGTKCSFKVVFPNGDGKYISRHLGSTGIGRRLPDDISGQSLQQIRFQVGDFISVAIYPARTEGKARGEEQRVRSEAAKRGDGEEEDSKGDRGRGSKPAEAEADVENVKEE